MKFLPSISKTTKKTLIGGAVAGAVVGLESGVSWFVAGYPQVLKDKLAPVVPRNGALLANLAPAGYALMNKKKGKRENLSNGILFYDLPKLLDQFAYNIAYQMGIPTTTQRAGVLRVNGGTVRASVNNGVARTGYIKVGTGAGKYAMSTGSRPLTNGSLGRYR